MWLYNNYCHLLDPITVTINDIIKPNMLFKVKEKGIPIKIDENLNLTDNDDTIPEYGDLIIDFNIKFPSRLDSKRIEILKKIFNYKENNDQTSLVVNPYIQKTDIVKELMDEQNNETNEEQGCLLVINLIIFILIILNKYGTPKELVELNNQIELQKFAEKYYEIDFDDDEEEITEINKIRNNLINDYNKENFRLFKLKKNK